MAIDDKRRKELIDWLEHTAGHLAYLTMHRDTARDLLAILKDGGLGLRWGVADRKTGEVFAAFKYIPDRFNVCERMGWNKHDHNKMVDLTITSPDTPKLVKG